MTKPRSYVPPAVYGLQVNCCKTPGCENAGLPVAQDLDGRRGRYLLTATGKQQPAIKCLLCGVSVPVKSNGAVVEEQRRLDRLHGRAASLDVASGGCPDSACTNASSNLDDATAFHRFGRSEAGSQRYRCRACGKTVSVAWAATHRQRRSDKNVEIFRLLVNKAPIRRIVEVAGITPDTFYRKLQFFARACREDGAAREQALGAPSGRSIYASIDKQDHILNWGTQFDRRNVRLHGFGIADNRSGYVFTMAMDFDGEVDPEAIELDAQRCGDYDLPIAHRRHARFWLKEDYDSALQLEQRLKQHAMRGRVDTPAVRRATALLEAKRQGLDDDAPDEGAKRPAGGLQVRIDYLQLAALLELRNRLAGVEKIRLYLDREAGLSSAAFVAFKDWIPSGRAAAFLVRLVKDMTIDQRRRAKATAEARRRQLRSENPGLTDGAVSRLLLTQEVAKQRATAPSTLHDHWFRHPLPTMAEPDRQVQSVTDTSAFDDAHLAALIHQASLHGIDRFFMLVRRRLSLLERPIHTASSRNRVWYGYAAYSPKVVENLLVVFRWFYNYALPGEDGKTPAMRLGLASEVIDIATLVGPRASRPRRPG